MTDKAQRLSALVALLNAGRNDEAATDAAAMIADGLAHPLPLGLLAAMRQREGRMDEAVALHRMRIPLMGADPSGWAALASCLFAARRPEAALEAWDEALALAPDEPRLLSGKAAVVHGLGGLDEARALYRRALSAAPALVEAQFGLAQLALETGDLAEAASLADSLSASHPSHPAVNWLSARIALNRGDFAGADAQLSRLLARPDLAPAQRADALLLQSEALDAADRPAAAFAAAAEGKRLQRVLHAERAAGREGETVKLDRLAAWFRATDSGPWREAAGAASGPQGADIHVFLVGFPRSGTTLLEQVLAGHPEVSSLEEAPTLAAHYAELMSSVSALEHLAHLAPREADAWRGRYWDEVRSFGGEVSGRLFLDKAPAGTLYLPLIAKLFPRAKVLFAVRDPRDVVLSCFRNNFQLNAMTYAFTDLAETAACYHACMTMAEVYRRVLPLDLREVRHERLVEDFDAELGAICDFLGIEPTPAMADIAATAAGRAVRTPSARQVRAGLNRGGLARWRAYAKALAPVQPVLAPWVERFGYAEG
jgi:tetratricopeptide (TPR) repeat protein